MGNQRFAYEDPTAGAPVADGEHVIVLLDQLYVGAFDEPGKGEVLLSLSFSTYSRYGNDLEPASVLKEIGLPRLKNHTEVDWLRGVVLFGPAPVHRSLAVTVSALELDRGDTASRRVDSIAGFAGRLGAPADMAWTARRFDVLSSFLAMVNALNADDLILQESDTFLTADIPGVPRLREGKIGVRSGHADREDRTRLALSVRRVTGSRREASTAAWSRGARRRAGSR